MGVSGGLVSVEDWDVWVDWGQSARFLLLSSSKLPGHGSKRSLSTWLLVFLYAGGVLLVGILVYRRGVIGKDVNIGASIGEFGWWNPNDWIHCHGV